MSKGEEEEEAKKEGRWLLIVFVNSNHNQRNLNKLFAFVRSLFRSLDTFELTIWKKASFTQLARTVLNKTKEQLAKVKREEKSEELKNKRSQIKKENGRSFVFDFRIKRCC